MVSPKLPDDIDALTLSYTFLRHGESPDSGSNQALSNSKG